MAALKHSLDGVLQVASRKDTLSPFYVIADFGCEKIRRLAITLLALRYLVYKLLLTV